MRLGLCCLFYEQPIKFRTTTAAALRRGKVSAGDTLGYLASLVKSNLASLKRALVFCQQNGIGSFRISSGLFPLYTHPDFRYQIELLPGTEDIFLKMEECRQYAKDFNIRLTFHPDQFVVLNSPSSQVIKNSIQELEYHTTLSEYLGVDVINIHAGGAYGDKKKALAQLAGSIRDLSPRVRQRLTLENDDKIYTPEDLLDLCTEYKIPLVYDVHHHRCNKDSFTVEKATKLALKTWNREPLFHISSPAEGWTAKKIAWHHDFISIEDFPSCWLKIDPLTVEVEAKAKEVAVLRLVNELKQKLYLL